MNNKVRIFETFAGIGTQKMALDNIGVEVEIIGMSEWYTDAILAYGEMHSKTPISKEEKMIPLQEKKQFLMTLGLSKNSFDVASNMNGLSEEYISKLYHYVKEFNNVGTIFQLTGDKLKNVDLLTYSFPCTDLSTGGKGQGMKRNSGTRSGLLWEIERVLKETKEEDLPEVLLMENVRAILAETHREDFEEWQNFLKSIGYENVILDLTASDFGTPQNRRRIFMISSRKKLDINVEAHKVPCKSAKDYIRTNYEDGNIRREAEESTVNMTPSRVKMWNTNKRDISDTKPFNTITTSQDRQNNAGMLPYNAIAKDSNYRLLTAREVWLLMGIKEELYEIVDSNLGLSYRKMVKLAGNAIVVQVLEAIFKEVKKNYTN